MDRRGLVRAGAVTDFADDKARAVSVSGFDLVIVRSADRWYAIRGVCPHESGPLGQGVVERRLEADTVGRNVRIVEGAPVLACPWHGYEFDLGTGCALYNARYRVASYPVHVEGDAVLVDLSARRI